MSSELIMKIIAVVVTYNRRALLEETLNALDIQTIKPSQIILIDNNSSDGTEHMVSSLQLSIPLQYERLRKNIGGAGGFKRGMQLAYTQDADWLWCMDDDCVPHNDSLEKLLAALQDEMVSTAGFLASRVLWTDGTPCLMNLPVAHHSWISSHGKNPYLSRIIGSSFVSMLVSRNAIDTVGFPVEEFFIWFDDAEYSRRISKVMPAYLVTDSVVTHKTPRNSKPLDFDELDEMSLWKYRYGLRNECSFHLQTEGSISAFLFIARILSRMVGACLALRFWPPIIKSCLKGLFFKYPRYIEFPNGVQRHKNNTRIDRAEGHIP